jgi:hypothetical protein
MASMILSWCFDVLTKILISHLLTCHRLSTTPRPPPTPSDHWIPSNISLSRGKRNMEVRNGRQVYLPDTFWLLTSHTSFYCFLPGGILLHAPRTQPTPLPTHRSPRIHERRGVNEIWRLFVEESQVEMRWELELYLFSNFSISPLLVDCCCCANKQHATINHPKFKTSTIKIRNTQQSTLGWMMFYTLPEDCKLFMSVSFLFWSHLTLTTNIYLIWHLLGSWK